MLVHRKRQQAALPSLNKRTWEHHHADVISDKDIFSLNPRCFYGFFWGGGGLNDIKAMGYFQSLRQQSVIEPSEFLVIEAFSSHPLFPKNCVSA